MRVFLSSFILSFLLLTGLLGFEFTSSAGAQPYYTAAKQAYIVDFDSGTVLLNKNGEDRMPTSSMSKIMTIYMVFEALSNGRIDTEDTFLVSEKAWRKGGSKMFVEVGKHVRIEDLIRGVIVQSGNDATIVLAEGLAANEDKFAQNMTAKAHDLGAANTNFANASGWPDPDHYSTAKDLSIIAGRLIRDFPEFYHYYAEQSFTYNDITQSNRNPLLYQDIGADGIKTGHTEIAGYGLIGSGTRDGRRVIMVVNGLDSTSARAKESRRLLNWALRSFRNIKVFEANTAIETIPVVMGRNIEIPVSVAEDILVTIPKGQEKNIKVTLEYQAPLRAPIDQGQEIGQIRVELPNGESIKAPLLAMDGSAELGFIERTLAKAKLLLTGGPDVTQ